MSLILGIGKGASPLLWGLGAAVLVVVIVWAVWRLLLNPRPLTIGMFKREKPGPLFMTVWLIFFVIVLFLGVKILLKALR